MAKRKKLEEEIIVPEEKLEASTPEETTAPSVPVSEYKDFVLIDFRDAVRLQNMLTFGMGRRMKKIIRAHKVKHGLVDKTNIEQNAPKSRTQILQEVKERDLKKEIQQTQVKAEVLGKKLPKK